METPAASSDFIQDLDDEFGSSLCENSAIFRGQANRQATLPKPGSEATNGAFSPANLHPWATGPPGKS